jgi:uncharacterized protein with PIN domain
MRFIADGMLGKLVRWLRLSGHDVVYINDIGAASEEQDEVLLSHALQEKRIILTRDSGLYRKALRRGLRGVFIREDDVIGQLVEISKRLGQRVDIQPENSRCPLCNGLLKQVNRSEVGMEVPENVKVAQEEFWKCIRCGKTYWQGSHWETIEEMISRYNSLLG